MTDRLTNNFKRSEFECACGCGFDTVDYQLVQTLQDLRDMIGSMRITSGCRCASHNAAVGGATTSQHVLARAADFLTDKPDHVAGILNEWFPDSCGIGIYSNRVHFDTRANAARWDTR